MSASGQVPGGDFQDGLAIATTSVGEVMLTEARGETRGFGLHAVESLTGKSVRTGKDSYLFLSLSNGSALAFDEKSDVLFHRYGQRPYPSETESHRYEPSRSEVILQLKQGSFAFAAERLSPPSRIMIELPVGEIEIHKASGHVTCDARGARITLTSGIVGFAAQGRGEQEFINAPNTVQVRFPRGELSPIAESTPESNHWHERAVQLVQAAHHAANRVIFKVHSQTPAIPRPVLVTKPETLRKAPARPYTYRD
jgi:hypothetical protein